MSTLPHRKLLAQSWRFADPDTSVAGTRSAKYLSRILRNAAPYSDYQVPHIRNAARGVLRCIGGEYMFLPVNERGILRSAVYDMLSFGATLERGPVVSWKCKTNLPWQGDVLPEIVYFVTLDQRLRVSVSSPASIGGYIHPNVSADGQPCFGSSILHSQNAEIVAENVFHYMTIMANVLCKPTWERGYVKRPHDLTGLPHIMQWANEAYPEDSEDQEGEGRAPWRCSVCRDSVTASPGSACITCGRWVCTVCATRCRANHPLVCYSCMESQATFLCPDERGFALDQVERAFTCHHCGVLKCPFCYCRCLNGAQSVALPVVLFHPTVGVIYYGR